MGNHVEVFASLNLLRCQERLLVISLFALKHGHLQEEDTECPAVVFLSILLTFQHRRAQVEPLAFKQIIVLLLIPLLVDDVGVAA